MDDKLSENGLDVGVCVWGVKGADQINKKNKCNQKERKSPAVEEGEREKVPGDDWIRRLRNHNN